MARIRTSLAFVAISLLGYLEFLVLSASTVDRSTAMTALSVCTGGSVSSDVLLGMDR